VRTRPVRVLSYFRAVYRTFRKRAPRVWRLKHRRGGTSL
jgi:hypothetical protein